MSKKLLKRTVIILAGILFLNITAFAKKERYMNSLEGAKGNLKKDSSVAVSDSNVAIVANSWNSYMVLRVNELYGSIGLVSLPDSFTVSINLTIAYKNYNSGNQSPLLKDTTIQLTYNRLRQTNLRVIQQLGANNYVKLTINDITIAQASAASVLPYLVLENYLEVDRTYDLNCTTPLIGSLASTDPSATDADELLVNWAKVAAAEEYDLEWSWVDKKAFDAGLYGPAGNPNLNAIFYNNATRVNITAEQYKIPLLFDDNGILFFRVRPVQYLANGQRKTGVWSVPNSNSNGNSQFVFSGHQRNLNWQSSTSFAEEGKRKSVVQYFDGSLKNRQTVTKDNLTGTTVVAETFYDRQGRPAVQVLPAPTLSTLIKYTPKFNTYLNGAEFDKDAYDRIITPTEFCGIAAPKLDPISGASNYYSPLNPEKNVGFNKFIPDAAGYPYTETRYTQDNTGRIAAQSGVGPIDTLGSDHETKYYYSAPSQEQMDALFGTEAGYANYYQKTMVKDANGQYSVSYSDMNGKTVATALAGTAPPQLSQLSNYTNQTLTENLLTKENTYIDGKSIISSTSFLVSKAAVHTFDYSLTPESLQAASCVTPQVPVCYDCLYDLEITITNDCSNAGLPGNSPYIIRKTNIPAVLDTTCNDAGPGNLNSSFNIFLSEGTVNITKKLTISDSSMQKYREIYIRNNSCRTKEDFIFQWTDSIRKGSPCSDSIPKYNDATNYRELMLADMSPPSGQYARPSNTDNDPSYNKDDPSTWPPSFSIFKTGSTPIYKTTTYFNPDGSLSLVQYDNEQKVPGDIPENAFIQNFEPQWANDLLKFHPEYDRLLKYESYKPSYIWDEEFDNTNTYQQALSKHFITPLGSINNYNNLQGSVVDPFFIQQTSPDLGEPGLLSDFRSRLINYISINGVSLNLWQFVNYSIKCGSSNSSSADLTCFGNSTSAANVFDAGYLCENDLQMAWVMFKSLYLQAKKSYVNERIQLVPLKGTSSIPAPAIPRFITNDYAKEVLGLNNVPNNDYVAYINQQNATYAKTICESYAEYWWDKLSPCGFNKSDSSAIINEMINVCKKGFDENHPYGSSSVDKSKYPTEMPESFIVIIDSWAKAKNKDIHACNGYLIDAPKPFNVPAIVVDKPLIEKPDSCTCTRIQQLKAEASSKGYSGNLSGYLKQFYQTEISSGILDTLEAKCSGTLDNCRFLPSIINLPPILQCSSTPPCITCEQAKLLKDSFLLHYPGTITYSANDTIQANYNKLFANYMNYHTGFGFTQVEYLQFLDNCAGSLPSDTTCNNLQNIVSSFKNEYFKQPIHLYDNTTGCDTARWVSNFGEGKLQVAHLNEVVANGEFVPKVNFPNYSSIDYYDTICLGNKLVFETRLKLPRTGHTYNPYVIDSTLYLLSNEFFFETPTGSVGIDIPLSSVADSTVVYGTNGGVKLPVSLDDYRTIKVEVFPTSYKYYIDGTFVTEFPHELYTKFNGYDFGPYSENFRIDWMKISDENNQVLMFEDFNSCGNLAQITKDPCKPDCQTSFTQYFNQNRSTNYTYSQIDSFYISHCGKSIDVCTPGVSCDNLKNIVSSFKDQYYKKPLHLYNATTGCDTARWVSNYGEGKLQVTPLSQEINNGSFIPKADNSGNLFSSIDYYDTICLGNKLTFETRLKMPKNGHAFNIYSEDTTLYSFSNLFYFHTQSGEDEYVDLPINSFAEGGTILYSGHSSLGTFGPETVPTDFSDYKTIKLEVTPTTFRYYIDGTFIAQFPHQTYTHFQGYNFQPMESTFSIDWMKISDESGQVLMFEDFVKGCSSLDQIAKNPCQPDCQTAFANYFNEKNNTRYNFFQIDSLYYNNCGKSLNVCNGNNASANTLTLCGRATSDAPYVTIIKDSACSDIEQLGIEKGTFAWKYYQDSLNNQFDKLYLEKCLGAAKLEKLTVTHDVSEYNYTLYFYDRAGNLAKTVPPASVTPNYNATWLADIKASRENRQTKTVNYSLATNYRYNSLNQVVAQITPDGGLSQFWYDRLGRLVLSQNAKQKVTSDYSYTLYDQLGRITEVGQKKNTSTVVNQILSRDNTALNSFVNANNSNFPPTQVTKTVYDLLPDYNATNIPATFSQQPYTLRNRVSYTKYFDHYTYASDASINQTNYTTATYYNYDIHGNVKQLLNDYNGTALGVYTSNKFKLINYDYDLISGKVNQVSYQPGKADQFYHRYVYDAENRITDVFTTTNPLFVGNTFLEDHDAFYQYYKHGPLARAVIGQQQVQGIDYAYTLQGWLKGINTTAGGNSTFDMGSDGANGSAVAKDAYGFGLYYYPKDYLEDNPGSVDYKPINSSVRPFAGWSYVDGIRPLYNGNISAMSVSIPSVGDPLLYIYRYDQLNRLKDMRPGKLSNMFSENTWGYNPEITQDFAESISYDANGNILNYNRNGNSSSGKPLGMDQLTYSYKPNTNQLDHIEDAIPASNYSNDIDKQFTGNYKYDEIGNLTEDNAEGILNIEWTVYGKIKKITKRDGSVINYNYGTDGNRVSEEVIKDNVTTSTHYVRDAQGNVMSIYTNMDNKLYLKEQDIYGSSRLGVYKAGIEVTTLEDNVIYPRLRGNTYYELTNHLGNVLATVGDNKLPVVNSSGNIDYYKADVKTANDYYPFGMLMPGRSKFETETTETKDIQSCISCSGLQGLISDYFKSIADNAMAGSGSEAAMLSYMQDRLQTDGYTYTTQQIQSALNLCNNGWQKNVALRTLGIAVFGGSRLVFHSENFSVEGWVYNNLNDNQMHSIISSMGYLAGTYSGYSLYLRDGHVYWQLADGYKQVINNQSGLPAEGGSAQCRTVSTISSNQWHHIVAVRVGNNALDFKIYVDGVLQQIEVADYAAMTNGDIYSEYVNGQVLTAYGDGVYNWGFVKNIRVYRKVITDAEAAANYSSCTGAPTDNTGLLVWGKFDEGSGTVAVDHSPYAIDGEIRQYQWHGGVGDAVAPGCITQNESVLCKTTTVTVPKVQGYRYGFNGKENDNEVKGEGNSLDFGARIYDPRIGRFLSGDPLADESPEFTTYGYAYNNPIFLVDVDGQKGEPVTIVRSDGKSITINRPVNGQLTQENLKSYLDERTKEILRIPNNKPVGPPKWLKWGSRLSMTITAVLLPANYGQVGPLFETLGPQKYQEYLTIQALKQDLKNNPSNTALPYEIKTTDPSQLGDDYLRGVKERIVSGKATAQDYLYANELYQRSNRTVEPTNSKSQPGVIYLRIDENGVLDPYVGQAESEDRYNARQREHSRDHPKSKFKFYILTRGTPGEDLHRKEQRGIDFFGGPNNTSNPDGGTSNKRDQRKKYKSKD